MIELLVVISIIGVIASVALVNMGGMKQSAIVAQSKTFATSIQQNIGIDLIGAWDFDEGSGAAAKDVSGNGNDGALVNAPTWETDKANCVSGGCLIFDGTNDYVLGPDNSSLRITGDITLSFWVKPDTASNSFMAVVTKEYAREWLVAVDVRGAARSIAWRHGDGVVEYVTFNNVFTNGNVWYHIACTRTASPKMMTCYKNGAKVGAYPYLKDIASGVLPLTIGSGASTYYFKGSIDEVRIYNQALTSLTIKQNYLAGLQDLLDGKQIAKAEYYERTRQPNN